MEGVGERHWKREEFEVVGNFEAWFYGAWVWGASLWNLCSSQGLSFEHFGVEVA